MPPGSFTEQLDLPFLLVGAFFLFFLGLVYYLRQEDKREGYPLESDRSNGTGGRVQVVGFPPLPKPKAFIRPHGRGIVFAPRPARERELNAVPAYRFPGAPLMPLGDPLLDGIGPASYALKEDEPDLTYEGKPKIEPMRDRSHYRIEKTDPYLFGMAVFAADGEQVGTIKDLWINNHEYHLRYIEVETLPAEGGRRIIAPYAFCQISRRKGTVRFGTVTRAQFLRVPPLANSEQITMREEDRLNAYFAGGTLYAKGGAQGPFL